MNTHLCTSKHRAMCCVQRNKEADQIPTNFKGFVLFMNQEIRKDEYDSKKVPSIIGVVWQLKMKWLLKFEKGLHNI